MSQSKEIAKNAGKAAKSTDLTLFIQYTQSALTQALLIQGNIINFQRKVIIGCLVVFCFMSLAIVGLAQRDMPEPEYFGRDKEGHYFNLVPLDKNEVHLTEMRLWAEGCAIDSLELSFVNTIGRINEILNKCFDKEGKASYQNWLLAGTSDETIRYNNTNTIYADSELGLIVTKNITLSASPRAPSRIREIDPVTHEKTGELIKRWEVTLPILLRKDEGSKGSGTNPLVSKITLIRTNNTSFKYGVAVNSFTLLRDK